MPTQSRLAVIVTALPLERAAILQHLREVSEEPVLNGSIYRRGVFDERSEPWSVIVAEIGAGNLGAAAEAERLISHYSPQIAVFVGVAGAVKDLKHGDVVASTKVYGYESGKDLEDSFKSRPAVQLSSYALEQRARYEAGEPNWRKRIKGGITPLLDVAPSAKVAPIAAGEKVVASNRSATYKFIRDHYGDAVAVEMEGHGFLLGVRMNHPTQGIVIRGISDLVDDKDEANDENWQPIAANNAAAFTFEIIAKSTPTGQTASSGLSQYREAIKRSATGLDWWQSAIPLYAAIGGDESRHPAREALLSWQLSDCDHCVILGDPGSGKSGLLRWLAYDLAAAEGNSIPLIISAAKIRQLKDVTLSSVCELADPRFEISLFTDRQRDERLFVFLDGLDELVGAECHGAAVAYEILGKLCGVIPSDSRVIATCRTPTFPLLSRELRAVLPTNSEQNRSGDDYARAFSRAINARSQPPLVIRLLSVEEGDAVSFLRHRLPAEILENNLRRPTIRPFLGSPFAIRLLTLALPRMTEMGSVSLVDLYRIYVDAALLREKPGLSQRELDSVIRTLQEIADGPFRYGDPVHTEIALNSGILKQNEQKIEFAHYTLWEYLFSGKVHRQIKAWNCQLLGRLDLVRGYYLNRFLVPMMLSTIADSAKPKTSRVRIVSSDEYRNFLDFRGWRKGTGYGLHPSVTLADDGTVSATFAIKRSEAWSIHDDSSHGDQVASGISWYDAAVFALHCGASLPSSEQLKTFQMDGDYIFWGAEWFDEQSTHMCAYDVEAGEIVGINPDIRIPRLAIAVVD